MPALKFILGGDASPFEREMRRVAIITRQSLAAAARSIAAPLLGYASFAGITNLVRQTIRWGSTLRDTADMIGVNVEWLQRMQNGARLVGADIEEVAKVISELNRSRQDALQDPRGKNAQAFGRLGVGAAEIANLSTQEFFQRITQAFKNGSSAQLENDVFEVGGKSARKLIAAFANQFASDLPVIAEALIDQLDDIDDRFTELGTTLKIAVAPAILAVAEAASALLGHVKDSGSFFGAASEAFMGEFSKTNNPNGTARNIWDRIAYGIEAAWNAGASAAVGNEAERKDIQDRAAQATATARENRRRRERAGPMFDLPEMEEKERMKHSRPSRASGSLGSLTDQQRHGAFIRSPEVDLLDVNRSMDRKLGRLVELANNRRGGLHYFGGP